MKKILRKLLSILFGIAVVWGLLTVFVQLEGREEVRSFGTPGSAQRALVVYDPDPFYNLDQQVSEHFAEGLVSHQWQVRVATVAAAKKQKEKYDLYVFCANTYNWAPDRALARFIEAHDDLSGSPVVAITVGSGSTTRSQRLLEKIVVQKGAVLIASRSLWLMRPNDENRMEESNVEVANYLAKEMGEKVARRMKAPE